MGKRKPKFVQLNDPDTKSFPDIPKEPLIKIVPREEWGAGKALAVALDMVHPVTHVRYNQTHTDNCTTKEECSALLQKLQKSHQTTKGIVDISYNFMIAGDGTVYEGRGWSLQPKRHEALEKQDYYLDVAYIGTFTNKEEPTWDQSVSAQRFLKYAIENKYLDRKYTVTHLNEIADP